MSDVTINCPHCSQTLEVPDELLGQTVECPSCNGSFQLPAPQPAAAPPPRKKPIARTPPAASSGAGKTMPCPMCGEDILAVAKKCKHCGSMLDGSSPAQDVTVKGKDPFAEYHTPIQGKKKGKLTVIGIAGIAFGALAMLVSIAGCFATTDPDATEGIFYMFLVGLGFMVASYLWARK